MSKEAIPPTEANVRVFGAFIFALGAVATSIANSLFADAQSLSTVREVNCTDVDIASLNLPQNVAITGLAAASQPIVIRAKKGIKEGVVILETKTYKVHARKNAEGVWSPDAPRIRVYINDSDKGGVNLKTCSTKYKADHHDVVAMMNSNENTASAVRELGNEVVQMILPVGAKITAVGLLTATGDGTYRLTKPIGVPFRIRWNKGLRAMVQELNFEYARASLIGGALIVAGVVYMILPRLALEAARS